MNMQEDAEEEEEITHLSSFFTIFPRNAVGFTDK